jgi:hypothetical protein
MPITTFDPEKPEENKEQSLAVNTPAQSGPLGFVDDSDASGEITAEDIKFPRLAVVHKIGELSELFPGQSGAFTLNKDGILCPPGSTLDVTAVFAKKYYEEDVGFDSGTFGKRAATAQEVLNQGGSLMRGDEHYYAPVADILFLVRQPEKLNPVFEGMFFYEVSGASHLLALFTARSTAYNGVAVPLWTLKQQRGSVRASQWKLTTVLNTYNNKSWHKPVIRPAGVTNEAYMEFMKGLSF